MQAFSVDILEFLWREQTTACTAFRTSSIRVTMTFTDRQGTTHTDDFVLPLNTLQNISHTADYDYRWCASPDDLMDKVKTRWNIQHYKLQSEDSVYLFTDTCLVVRDEQ